MSLVFILILIACLVFILIVGKYQLVSDNSFYYTSGRSMRPLDIFLAFEKRIFNERISKLDEPTRNGFRKWLTRDMILGLIVHLFVAMLAIWCITVYTSRAFITIFYVLAWAQLLSFIMHVLADIIMRRSVDRRKLGMRIAAYNTIVILKLAIPVIGIFMGTTTLILVWFQFLYSFQPLVATMLFLSPILLLTIFMMKGLTTSSKTPIQ